MKRIVVYVLWLDVECRAPADENKFRYNMRQFAKTIKDFEKEGFDVDIHIISCEGEEKVLSSVKKVLQVAKKQDFLKCFKTLALCYGHRLISLEKYAADFCVGDDIYLSKTNKKVERCKILSGDNVAKTAKSCQEDVKNNAKTSTLYKYLRFGRDEWVDVVEEKLSIKNIIRGIKSALYETPHKIISGEVCISDFAGLNKELGAQGVVNIVLPEEKRYSILVSNKSKELPASFSLDGHKLLYLLYSLDAAQTL